MAQTTVNFADRDQVTSAKLDEIVSGLSFTSGDINGTTLAIVGGKLQLGTVTASNMGALSVPTAALQAGCVTAEKIGLGVVGALQLGNLAVTTQKLAIGAVGYNNINASAISIRAQIQGELSGSIPTPNLLKYLPGAAKGYGEFNIINSNRTIKANSYNVAALVRLTSSTTQVNITTNMNTANYTVVPSMVTAGAASPGAVEVYDKQVGSFKLKHPVEAADLAVNFTVFGTYA